MKVQLKQNAGVSTSKLACVKRIKEITGYGLREAKELVDSSTYELVTFDVKYNRAEIERMKREFEGWGYTLIGGREEALDGLLGDIYIYVVEYLNRDITYKIEEGEYSITDGFYMFDVELGVKLDDTGEKKINGRKIKIPMDSVIIETNK